MRTTLAFDDDALDLARDVARRRRVSLGKAVSDLLRRGARPAVLTTDRNGLTVMQLPADTPPVAADTVDALLDELP